MSPRWFQPTARFSGAEVVYRRMKLPGPRMRIVFVTDVHRSRQFTASHLDLLCRQTAELAPDLLLLGGDYGESRDYAREVLSALGRVPAPRGRVGCVGNNDARLYPDRDELRALASEAGISLLVNETLRLDNITVSAIDDIRHGQPAYTDPFLGAEGLRICLSHAPHALPPAFAAMTVRPHLAFCGHTHGGQFNIFGLTPYSIGFETMLETRLPKPPLVSGDGEYLGVPVIVSNGIGTSRIPLRLGAPPQIWAVDIVN